MSKSASFLTLTYDDGQVPVDPVSGLNTLVKSDYQKFMKDLRDFERRKLLRADKLGLLRYYACGEYGTKTQRPHYHSILFNMSPISRDYLPEIWKKGFVHVGSVTGASIGYVTKYVINRPGDYTGRQKPFAVMSNRSGGLGKDYLVKFSKWHKSGKRFYVKDEGVTGRLPRYYQDKIFNQHEKELRRYELMKERPEEYWEEIRQLSEFHSEPQRYYEERILQLHDAIKNKANENSKF